MLPLLLFVTLPHVDEVAPGVWASGFAARHGSANTGWFIAGAETVLVDLPPAAVPLDGYLAEVKRISGRPALSVLFTSEGVAPPAGLRAAVVDSLPGVRRAAGGAIFLERAKVLFAGPAVTNGPRADVTRWDTAAWLDTLTRLEALGARRVVPGKGSWGGADVVARQKRFLAELRRQVAYGISMGRPLGAITGEILLPASYYTWMPYDLPTADDIRHVYSELTAPRAPFYGRQPKHPSALVLIADRYHEPEHLEAGLRPALSAAGIEPWFTVDVTTLNAGNLSKVDLLVILRDGMLWPEGTARGSQYKIWMTPEQEKAVVDFVEGGKAFLNLHNSMGLYPKDGPYLKLVAGNYIGHGPLERFRVEVVDKTHPITQGVSDWSAADEQHTPPYDEKKARLLLRNRSDDGKTAAAGWAYEPGKGRLAHLASGHTRDALEHPMFQRLLRNALEWCLRLR